ncbi:MAG: hypothetical protein Fur0044_51740 [Anaerolineae bacterium]
MLPASSTQSGRARVFFLGLLQLLICLLALWWAWRIWQNAGGAASDRFWAALALALFAGGLAQINLVGPLRERLSRLSTSRLALPVRLSADGAPQGLEWPMFSLALAFALPFLPLLLVVFNLETEWMVEMRLIWIGLALVSALVTAFGGYLGGQALYKRLAGGQTIVEVERETAQAGQTLQGFVWHQSGRIPSEQIKVELVGRKTLTRRGRVHRTETTILHREVLVPAVLLDPALGLWQKSFSFTIPLEARSSAPHTANPMIIWGLDVQVNLKDAPDFTLTFPFTVQGLEPETDDEEDQEIDEAIEN